MTTMIDPEIEQVLKDYVSDALSFEQLGELIDRYDWDAAETEAPEEFDLVAQIDLAITNVAEALAAEAELRALVQNILAQARVQYANTTLGNWSELACVDLSVPSARSRGQLTITSFAAFVDTAAGVLSLRTRRSADVPMAPVSALVG